MTPRVHAAVAILATLVTAACSDPAEPLDDFAIRTDAEHYLLRPGPLGLHADIGFVFRNRTGEAVYVINCNGAAPPSLQRLVGGEWTTVWAPVVAACISLPIVIPAGTTYGDVLQVRLDGRSEAYPDLDLDTIDGTYRLYWPNALSSFNEGQQGFGSPLRVDERVSNEFQLERD